MATRMDIEPGDRMPDFRRLDGTGEAFTLYADACGHPVLLILVDRRSDPVLELGALEALPPDTLPLLMIEGTPEGAAAYAKAHPGCPRVLADDGAIIAYLMAGRGTLEGIRAFALSPAHRLLAAIPTGEEPVADAARRVFAEHDFGEGRTVTQQAPALVIPEVFEPEFCRELIRVYHTANEPSGVLRMQEGRMVYEADTETKIRREHRIEDRELLATFESRMQRRVLPEIRWAFNYPVTRYEGVKVVLYDGSEGGHFKAHRDNDGPDTAHRRFAMTLNLNSEEYEGGELRFPEFSRDLYKPPSGSAVIFSCNLAHEALPVTRGQRYAMVSFFYGAEQQIQNVQYENRVRKPGSGWG